MNEKILIIDGPLMEFYRAKLKDGETETYSDLKKKLYEYGRSIDASISICQTNSIDKIVDMLCEEVKKEYYDIIIINTWFSGIGIAYNRISNTIDLLNRLTKETRSKNISFAVIRGDIYTDRDDNSKRYIDPYKSMFWEYLEAISKITLKMGEKEDKYDTLHIARDDEDKD